MSAAATSARSPSPSAAAKTLAVSRLNSSLLMTDIAAEEVNEPPKGHAKIVYLGPVAPHWEIRSDFGDRSMIDDFRARVMARLLLLPVHDPQFRRNRERIVRDAE